MSPAHIKQLIGFEFFSSSGIHASLVRCRGRSAKHACFKPSI